jgi:hypothetical protein
MSKAELIIDSKPDDDFLAASCSSCKQVRFRLTQNTLKHKELLRKMFDLHVRRVHTSDKDSTK